MGAHHARTTTIAPLTRVAGRGVLTATAALALTGAGAGAALAHDGSHGSDPERDDSASSQNAELCDVFGEVDGDMSDAGLDVPGLDDSGMCSEEDEDFFDDHGSSDHGDSADRSSDSSSPSPAPSSPATPAASPAPPAAPSSTAKPASTNPAAKLSPQDMPPAPGQTKTLQIPARTTS